MADEALAACLAEIKANCGRFYVYVLSKPCGTPFYVGYGRSGSLVERLIQHECEAKRDRLPKRCNRHRINAIRSILLSGEAVRYAIDSWFDDAGGAKSREVAMIAKIGRSDLGTGPLTNLTAGGDGSVLLTGDGKLRMHEGQKRGHEGRAKWAAANAGLLSEMGKRGGAKRVEWMNANPEAARDLQSRAGKKGIQKTLKRIAEDPAVRARASRAWAEAGARLSKTDPERAKALGKQAYVVGIGRWSADNPGAQAELGRMVGMAMAKRRAEDPAYQADVLRKAVEGKKKAKIMRRCVQMMTDSAIGIALPSRQCGIAEWEQVEQEIARMVAR